MAVESRQQLKTYFERLDRPTEAQFVNLIDSMHSKFHGLGTKISFSGNQSVVIPTEQALTKIWAWTVGGNGLLNIGDTAGGGEYMSNETITTTPRLIELDPVFALTEKTVVFQLLADVEVTINVKYYLQ